MISRFLLPTPSPDLVNEAVGLLASRASTPGDRRPPGRWHDDAGRSVITEHIARYLTRPPVRLDALQGFTNHQVTVTTPPDPRTGATSRTLDVLDWIHAITNQIPDRGQHLTRY